MPGRRILPDLGLVVEGLRIGKEFGLGSLEEMAGVAWFLERSIYERGSLRATRDGVEFALRNPPLRMGAFEQLSLLWDERTVPPDRAFVRTADHASPVPFSSVRRTNPVVLRPGVRSVFSGAVGPIAPGPHAARLELRCTAIPPPVWFQIVDRPKPFVETVP
ncbi:MAG TPA: hypothetical protein VJQ43_03695 [Thermoplasmata archaeon]|nr:hypothetical protein [Thermoplasmata archaeon]